ncbi:MAG: PilC/PilY family type IV pilus protein, partial [Betaproteobacteria bacterium]|nr:PilC/PilY family type IV pilus protein [Betaproteobacteria bacterium]
RDHKLAFEAYSDIVTREDGSTVDGHFNPRKVYYGLFDSKLCYQGIGVNINGTLVTYVSSDYFEPSSAVTDMQLHKCDKKQWSGNFLNYVTTSRMDALRRLLYGGTRGVDTATDTVLRRSLIPKDGHAWGKEYTSVAVDGYDIADYTPFSPPSPGNHHFFGNYDGWPGICDSCTLGAPVLAVALNAVPNSDLGFNRVWDWANADITVAGFGIGTDNNFNDSYFNVTGSNSKKYVMHVRACSKAFTLPDGTQNYRGENCRPYTDDKGVTVYKPVGILHKFGEDGSILFGLLTGSYDTNISGGVLRKHIGSFADEVNPKTGQFTANATIVKTFNAIAISGLSADKKNPVYTNYVYPPPMVGNTVSNRLMNEGEFIDWGNPIGEMMYEALRYLSGKGQPTAAFSKSPSPRDAYIVLSRPAWDKRPDVPQCTKPNLLVISDINPSFDSDQLPGTRFQTCTRTTIAPIMDTDSCTSMGASNTLDPINNDKPLNVEQLLDEISVKEGISGKSFFIGQSGNNTNWIPTAKTVSSLASIRGLAPEDPAKEGSYTSAAVAYYGKTVGIPMFGGKEKQKVNTYVLALSSPLPKIEVPTSKGIITLIPFGKTILGGNISTDKKYFQPSNQIVRINSVNINPHDPDNGGRYNATLLVTFDDAEHGSDFDMDYRIEYRVRKLVNEDVEVTLTPKYFANSKEITMSVGYVISGAGEQDGPYIVLQNRPLTTYDSTHNYYLNTPEGKPPGWCAIPANIPPSYDPNNLICIKLAACYTGVFGTCDFLGQYSTRVFTPSGNAATLLKDPLWYAAKWGGFRDKPGDTDSYFSIENPLALEKALVTAINSNFTSESGNQSSGLISTNSDVLSSPDTLVFSTTFRASANPPDWSGDLVATAITRINKDNPSGLGEVRWQAAEKLPAASVRRIFTRDNTNLRDISSHGVEFKWGQLNPNQQTALAWDGKFDGPSVLDYVRGSAENEAAKGGNFRNRTRAGSASSPLGDSPNNTPRYFKPTNTVYLGANDGMLHAFDAATGKELFTYVPSALIPKLPELASPNYGHDWYVDGEIAAGTIKENGSSKHMLIGALGRGGKGLFGLDVTNPAYFSVGNVTWEFNGTPTEQCGANANHDSLGLILGTPIIGTLNDGKTYALVGNGYNSCSGKAALYIIDIQTGEVAKRVEVPIAGGNGLSTPVALDVNGDGKIDLVYAGDLLGNLWRFDLRSDLPGNWGIRFGSSTTQPMFTARNDKGETQPITATPAVTFDNNGVPWVFFGTGRYIAIADKSNQDVQSWYGLIDDSGNDTITRSQLVKRTLETFGSNTRIIQKQENADDMQSKRGWFIDFDIKADAGERVISAPLLVKARRGTVVEIPTIIPGSDPCTAGGRGYINFVSAFSGAAVEFAFIDVNGDGIVDDQDLLPGSGSFPGSIDLENGMPGNITIVGDQNVIGGTGGGFSSLKKELGSTAKSHGRISWREIIRQ